MFFQLLHPLLQCLERVLSNKRHHSAVGTTMYKKRPSSCLRIIALQCFGQKSFHEQTMEEWYFIPRMMEKSVYFIPVANFSLKLALTALTMSPSSPRWIINTKKAAKASKNLNKQKRIWNFCFRWIGISSYQLCDVINNDGSSWSSVVHWG